MVRFIDHHPSIKPQECRPYLSQNSKESTLELGEHRSRSKLNAHTMDLE